MIGYDDRMTDFSVAGIEECRARPRDPGRAGVARPARRDDELAAAYLAERLGTSLALIDADEPLREINNLACPVQAVRDVFDVMAYDSVTDWEIAARRMEAVPAALRGLRETYEEGRSRHRGGPAPGARGGRTGLGLVRRP